MTSGTKGIFNPFYVFLFLLFIAACGKIVKAHEYIIDVKEQMLRASAPKNDKPLSYCMTNICYAYEDAEVKAIKKYVSELELRLKECKGK